MMDICLSIKQEMEKGSGRSCRTAIVSLSFDEKQTNIEIEVFLWNSAN